MNLDSVQTTTILGEIVGQILLVVVVQITHLEIIVLIMNLAPVVKESNLAICVGTTHLVNFVNMWNSKNPEATEVISVLTTS